MTEGEVKIIKDIIQKELRDALFRTIELEKAARPGEDKPKEGKVFEKVEMNVLEWFTTYLPYIEGALRGMQEQIAKIDNHVVKTMLPAIEAISEIFIQHEKELKEIGKLAKKLEPILEIAYESDPKRRLDNKTKLN